MDVGAISECANFCDTFFTKILHLRCVIFGFRSSVVLVLKYVVLTYFNDLKLLIFILLLCSDRLRSNVYIGIQSILHFIASPCVRHFRAGCFGKI